MGKDRELFDAAGNNDVASIRRLLQQGANVKWQHTGRFMNGVTPLHQAAWRGHKDAVRALLEAGADVGAKTQNGRTPLHYAASNGHKDAVRALLEAGADVGAKDQDGDTPLHRAAYWGQKDAVRALLEAGADVGAKNKNGKTAADRASSNNHGEVVALLAAAVSKPRPQPSPVPPAARPAPQPQPPQPVQPAQVLPLAQQPRPSLTFQGGSVSLLGVLTQEQVSPLNSRLVLAGLQAVGQVVGGALTCNPVALVLGCAMLVKAVTAEMEAVQYCRERIGRVFARCGAMLPALQKLQQVLSPPQSASLDNSLVQSISKTLLVLAQVLLGLEQLLARLQGGSGNRLARALRALKGQCYQQQLDDLEQQLRDCLQQLTAVIGISAFTQQVADALQGRQELQVARWAEQNADDRKRDLEQLEGQVLAVAGGVQALQLQLTQQAVELDGQRVALQDVLQWLQRMHAGSAVIAGHLQELNRKVDVIQDDVSAIKDQGTRVEQGIHGIRDQGIRVEQGIDGIKEQLEQLMLQAAPGRQQQQQQQQRQQQQQKGAPTDRLPQLAIAASRINAAAVREAMGDAASGAFGKVVRGKLDFVSDVAVKVFNLKQAGRKDCKEAVHEAVLLSMANHPQVVRCFGLVFDPESGKQSSIHGSLVMEWVGGGTLYDWLQEEEGEQLGLMERVQLALQVAAGLQHLHGKKLVHGDLKPQNVLLTERVASQRVPQAKICDFGLAKYTSPSMRPSFMPKQAYTPVYTSPERLQDVTLRTLEDDVYAFGMLLCYIATASDPFPGVDVGQLREAVISGQRPSIDKWAADMAGPDATARQAVQRYCQLAKDCWAAAPQRRPNASIIHQRLVALAQLLQADAAGPQPPEGV